MVCTERCKQAKGKLCKCSCKGENHGVNKKEEISMLTVFLSYYGKRYKPPEILT